MRRGTCVMLVGSWATKPGSVMTGQRVFVDANVLASRIQRDWLFLLGGEVRMFDTYITEDVLAETIRVHRRRRPQADGGEITRLRAALVRAADYMVDDFLAP